MKLGAHVSISGGVQNAPPNGHKIGCDVIQIFSKNQMQWRAPTLKPEQVEGFRSGVKKFELGPTLIHASYLLNLASPKDDLFEKSWRGLVTELERADKLGIPYVTFHPGSTTGDRDADWGCTRVAEGLTNALHETRGLESMILLETNAGQGSCVGRTFEELGKMIDRCDADKSRLGVCLDTCHIYVAGYPIHTEAGYDDTFETFDNEVGLDRLKCFHLNDSKVEFQSNRDRHDNIGKGTMGMLVWEKLMNDSRFADLPGYLETPGGEESYVEDLKLLRSLVKA